MFEKLTAVRNRYEEVNRQLTDPSVISDNAKYKALMREYKKLTPIVEKFDRYSKAKENFDEAKSILDEGGLDPEFKEMVQAQYEENKELTEKYLSLPQGFNMQAAPALLEAKIFVLKEEKALYIDDSVNSLKFYVFAKGQIKNSFKDPARAVVYADSEQGVVIDSENQVVWERGGRFLSSAVAGLDTVKVKKNESSVYTCAYMMLKTAGANVDMKDITKSSEPVMNLLGQYIAEPVNLSGCTFDEVLYFVSGKKPVVGMKDAYNAVVIVSYTTTSVTIYDPSTGKYSTISHSAADSMFSSAGNIFFSYVK